MFSLLFRFSNFPIFKFPNFGNLGNSEPILRIAEIRELRNGLRRSSKGIGFDARAQYISVIA